MIPSFVGVEHLAVLYQLRLRVEVDLRAVTTYKSTLLYIVDTALTPPPADVINRKSEKSD
jgi:hypothetical protein